MATKAYSYIRMSTVEQLKGDSLRRQIEATEAFVKEQGWELDDTITDLGKSAYRSSNRSEGALKEFLDKVENGLIPKGSFLIVESLDRLSRDRIFKALNLFTTIIEKDIGIVTLSDGMIYTEKKVNDNWTQLIVSLAIMSRAHEESRMKGMRVSAAWDKKRDGASEKKITSRCPGWLKFNKKSGEFEVIEERKKIITAIFEMSAIEGLGRRAIVRSLNSNKVPTFGKSKGWQESYVSKLLENENVLGTFQPLKQQITKDGKKIRVPYGDPIENYYPQIISYELFAKAKAASKARKTGGGKKGTTFSNLLQHLTFCGCCQTHMTFQDKGKTKKGGQYLLCDSNKRKTGCSVNTHYNYKDILFYVLSSNRVMPTSNQNDTGEIQKRKCQERIHECEIKMAQAEKARARWDAKFETEEDDELSANAGRKADEKLKEINAFKKEIAELTTTIEELESQKRSRSAFFKESYAKKVVERIHSCSTDDGLYAERAKINKELKEIYESIHIGKSDSEYLVFEFTDKSKVTVSKQDFDNSISAERRQSMFYLLFPDEMPNDEDIFNVNWEI